STFPPPAPAVPPAVTEPEPAVTPDAATAFPTKVQPILANLCADCHAKATYTGPFKLTAADGFEVRTQVTARNLRAAAAQVRRGGPPGVRGGHQADPAGRPGPGERRGAGRRVRPVGVQPGRPPDAAVKPGSRPRPARWPTGEPHRFSRSASATSQASTVLSS